MKRRRNEGPGTVARGVGDEVSAQAVDSRLSKAYSRTRLLGESRSDLRISRVPRFSGRPPRRRMSIPVLSPLRSRPEEDIMPLSQESRALLDQLESSGVPPLHTLSVEAARQLMVDLFVTKGDRETVGKVEDRQVPGAMGSIPVRFYTPSGTGPFPILVFFHGGGWVIGNRETHDATCRALTNAAGCIVASVDYRLAPEHKFPVAVEDSYAATRWIADHATSIGADPTRIAVGGDSAGGNLAATVSLAALERGGPPLVFQLLV